MVVRGYDGGEKIIGVVGDDRGKESFGDGDFFGGSGGFDGKV